MGVRICDYKFSPDEKWILPHNQMGLSFSASWNNLKFAHKMVSRKENPVDVFWVPSGLESEGLKFVEDDGNSGHYFLTVTKRMMVSVLVEKLLTFSFKLNVIYEGGGLL